MIPPSMRTCEDSSTGIGADNIFDFAESESGRKNTRKTESDARFSLFEETSG